MEAIAWIIVIVFGSGGVMAFMKSAWFQHKLLVKKAAPAAKPKTLAQVHAEDHALWLGDYKAILQKDCDHLYHHQHWYTCRICDWEEPWEYSEGCKCLYEELRTITDVHPIYSLIKRQPFCIVHGIDFKLYPVSDRKRGPYGPNNDSNDAVKRSIELTKRRSMRRIDYDIKGTN